MVETSYRFDYYFCKIFFSKKPWVFAVFFD